MVRRTRQQRDPSSAARLAFSLAELLVSLSIMAVLTGGLASAILIAGHALPDRRTEARAALEVGRAIDRLSADVALATSFSTRALSAITFMVNDRTGDGLADQVGYSWSGVAGDPLLCTLNGNTAVVALAHVSSVRFAFESRQVDEASTSTVHQSSGEVVLASFIGWAGVTPTVNTHTLTDRNHLAEAFGVSWPAGAGDCQVTRVRCRVRAGANPLQSVKCAVFVPDSSHQPRTQVGSEVQITNSGLPASMNWVDFSFSDVTLTAQQTDLAFRLRSVSSGTAVSEYWSALLAPANGMWGLLSTDNGGNWSPSALLANTVDVPFYVYGSYTLTSEQTATTSRRLLTVMVLELQTQDEPAPLRTRVALLNKPEEI